MKIRKKVLVKIRKRDIKDGKVIIPEGVIEIGERAFENCDNLEFIKLASTVEKIGQRAFEGCLNLKTVITQEGLREIGTRAFSNCKKLEEVTLVYGLRTIDQGAFLGCKALKSLDLPNSVHKLAQETFKGCQSLKTISLSQNITRIMESTFNGCNSLQEIALPDKVRIIENDAFNSCTSLKAVYLPKELVSIGNVAFYNCINLNQLEFPEGLKKIGEEAFSLCKSLPDLTLPNSIEEIARSAFSCCFNMNKLFVPNGLIYLDNIYGNIKGYAYKANNGYYLSPLPLNDNFDYMFDESHPSCLTPVIMNQLEHKDVILKDYSAKPEFVYLYNILLKNLSKEELSKFITTKNAKFFNKIQFNMLSDSSEEEKYAFIKLIYNLGGLEKPIEITTTSKRGKLQAQTIDYAQKVCNFIIDNNIVAYGSFKFYFRDMKVEGIKPEFTDFILTKNNLSKMYDEADNNHSFISRCYNEFEEIQDTNLSNKGSQHQLKPTLSKFKDYFNDKKFSGVTEDNKAIAELVSHYYSSQSTFDKATEIDKERIENGTPDNLINGGLKEQDIFKTIEQIQNNISREGLETLETLKKLADNKFTFEFLSKKDPKNFVLGKLCSCCAHLESSGYGIMHASIVSKDVQNLVIKDKKDKIIAKSTLYINREKGYGVFNNVEVNEKVKISNKEDIYNKYLLATRLFVQKFNKQNPLTPIRQINVGMNCNDLKELISANHQKTTPLKAIDYSKYGNEDNNYMSDSDIDQRIIYSEASDEQEL